MGEEEKRKINVVAFLQQSNFIEWYFSSFKYL